MPKQQSDALLQLIKSLTKSEKRHFRIFVSRNQTSDDILFVKLFDELDKGKPLDEVQILKKIPAIKKQQLSNLKAHLYKQILLCLRMVHRQHNEDIDIREKIDYARVLYSKGLYTQSLDMLAKAKTKALAFHQQTLALEVNEFEKLIESQYITGSIEGRAETLTQEATLLSSQISRAQLFSNMALQLYSLYLKVGYVRNQKDVFLIKEVFQNLPTYKMEDLTFFERLFLYQAYSMYYFVNQDFLMNYKYSQKWIDLFREFPEMVAIETPLYLKGLHNHLNSLFYLAHYERFVEYYNELLAFEKQEETTANSNIESLTVLYRYIHQIRKHFMEGTFSEGVKAMPELAQLIKEGTYNWDDYREVMFYYKIACMYFGSGDMGNTIDYLNKIINLRNPNFREDIQCFARVLNLIAHFELGNHQLLEYQVKSVYRFLLKMENMHEVQKQIIVFIRRIPFMLPSQLKKEFTLLRNNLVRISEIPYEKRAFLYLDIISWLESKIQGKTVQEIIKAKYTLKK